MQFGKRCYSKCEARKLTFSSRCSEFFTGGENKETIWGASYEESTEHHAISNEQVTFHSQMQQSRLCQTRNETVAMDCSSIVEPLHIQQETVRSTRHEKTVVQNVSIQPEKENQSSRLPTLGKGSTVKMFESLKRKQALRATQNQTTNVGEDMSVEAADSRMSNGTFLDHSMEITQPLRKSVICKSPSKENQSMPSTSNKTFADNFTMDMTQCAAAMNESVHPFVKNEQLRNNPYMKIYLGEDSMNQSKADFTEKTLTPTVAKQTHTAKAMSMDISEIDLNQSTGAVFIDYVQSKTEQSIQAEAQAKMSINGTVNDHIPIAESFLMEAVVDGVDKENVFPTFSRPVTRRPPTIHDTPMEVSMRPINDHPISLDISLSPGNRNESRMKSSKPAAAHRATCHKPALMDESTNFVADGKNAAPGYVQETRNDIPRHRRETCFDAVPLEIAPLVVNDKENVPLSEPLAGRRATCYTRESLELEVASPDAGVPENVHTKHSSIPIRRASLNKSVTIDESLIEIIDPVSEPATSTARRDTCYESASVDQSLAEVDHRTDGATGVEASARRATTYAADPLEMTVNDVSMVLDDSLRMPSRRVTCYDLDPVDQSIAPATKEPVSTRRSTSYASIALLEEYRNLNSGVDVDVEEPTAAELKLINQSASYQNAIINLSMELTGHHCHIFKPVSNRRGTTYASAPLETTINDENMAIDGPQPPRSSSSRRATRYDNVSIDHSMDSAEHRTVSARRTASTRRATTYASAALEETVNHNEEGASAQRAACCPTQSAIQSSTTKAESMSMVDSIGGEPDVLHPRRKTKLFDDEAISVDSTLNDIRPLDSSNLLSLPSSSNSSVASKSKDDTYAAKGLQLDKLAQLTFIDDNQEDLTKMEMELVNSSFGMATASEEDQEFGMPKLEFSYHKVESKPPSRLTSDHLGSKKESEAGNTFRALEVPQRSPGDDARAVEQILFKKSTLLRRSTAAGAEVLDSKSDRKSAAGAVPKVRRSSILSRRDSNTADPNRSEVSYLNAGNLSTNKRLSEFKLDFSGYDQFDGLATPFDVLRSLVTRTKLIQQEFKQKLEQQKVKGVEIDSQNVEAPSAKFLFKNKLKIEL